MLSERFLETIYDKYDEGALPELIGFDVLNEETIEALMYHLDHHRFVEARHHWYLDEEDPLNVCWLDIEGMGYGWVWNDGINDPETEESRHKNSVKEHILSQLHQRLEYASEVLVVIGLEEKGIVYHFVSIDFEDDHGYRNDLVVRCSQEELYFL